jgi:hypothetical protein
MLEEYVRMFRQQGVCHVDAPGMRPLVARCHLRARRLYRRAGQDARAKQHLGTARTMLGQTQFLARASKADLTVT